jgi:hypothetical protein
VSVSEETEAGWRRVRLPDGSVAFIQDSALRLVTEAVVVPAGGTSTAEATPVPASATVPGSPQAPVAPAAPAVTDRPVREAAAPSPKIYVKDLAHLADLVKKDELVGPKALALSERQTTANVVGLVGMAAGLAVGVLGTTVMAKEECKPPLFEGASEFCMTKLDFGMVYTGVGISLGSGLLWYLLSPKSGELLDVINEWNTRHPSDPFELTGNGAPTSR